ncbi:MAG: glutamate-1-semialdehyde 2,1-aminomutase [Cytophagaceae bacterium]|nr:glutamate-1-semialdehyde 2,1-aminomutase [Cytophagaceae bacterium]
MLNRATSEELFKRASKVIPGGVNSPVRAFKAVGGNPIFMKSAKGAYMTDVDGNQYLDFINSWGPMILGHASDVVIDAVQKVLADSFSFGAPTRREVDMAELIVSIVPSVEVVRMVNSGTEATMSAVRLARGYTGRDKIIKFEGCYHGHGDSFLIAAGSGAMTLGAPDSPGVTQGVANDTLTVAFNDLLAVEQCVVENKNKVAAIIVEPVVGNMGCVPPAPGFLEGLRIICDKEGIVLIFDEVMTGFRLSLGGAQELYGIRPDLTTMGKIIGGGMPVGAYGGNKEIMQQVAPAGKVYQAGTLSGNPIAMAAGIAMLTHLKNTPSVYQTIEQTSAFISDGILQYIKEKNLPCSVNRVGSMFTLFFTKEKVTDFNTAKTSDLVAFGTFFRSMLEKGIYLAPSQYESLFVSTAITKEQATQVVEAAKTSLVEVFEK